jgi:hypothetical protein
MNIKQFAITREINQNTSVRDREYQIKEIARNIAELIYKDGSCIDLTEYTDLLGVETVTMKIKVVVNDK